MAVPKVCVLRAPGTNCDVETAFAFESCGAAAERVHLFRALEQPERLRDFQILCIPGGFSYGDDVGAGVVFSRALRGRLADALHEFLAADRLVLGICNGFQVLLKSGILPDGTEQWPPAAPPATLTWNENGRYTALWVRLEVAAPTNVFLRGLSEIELPIAHAEGRFVVRDEAALTRLMERGQIALRYCNGDGQGADGPNGEDVLPFPANPNGSVANVAGLGDPTGRVLGLMPHPERYVFATQHPNWTRRPDGADDEGAGLAIFRNAVTYFG
jgi:phosphoribosylformylglycinamidine synthase